MENDDTHVSHRWLYDIHEVLFADMGLNIKQANRYGFELYQSDPKTNPFINEQLKEICFINYRLEYSYMLYWKAGHSLITQILEDIYTPIQSASGPSGFTHSVEPYNEALVVPYKDPLDKFLSAYFTSYEFKKQANSANLTRNSEIYDATRHITPGNVDQLTETCYNMLDKFIDKCLSNGNATGMGSDPEWIAWNRSHPNTNTLFDNHFYPVHLLVYHALRNRKDRFKLLGLNLDHGPESFIFKDIINSKHIPDSRKEMLLHRQSANNNFIKMICQKWKSNNSLKIKQLIDIFLLNDYKLIEVLDKNTLILNN